MSLCIYYFLLDILAIGILMCRTVTRQTAGHTSVTSDFFIHCTTEKLGRMCDQISRTLKPCERLIIGSHRTDTVSE